MVTSRLDVNAGLGITITGGKVGVGTRYFFNSERKVSAFVGGNLVRSTGFRNIHVTTNSTSTNGGNTYYASGNDVVVNYLPATLLHLRGRALAAHPAVCHAGRAGVRHRAGRRNRGVRAGRLQFVGARFCPAARARRGGSFAGHRLRARLAAGIRFGLIEVNQRNVLLSLPPHFCRATAVILITK